MLKTSLKTKQSICLPQYKGNNVEKGIKTKQSIRLLQYNRNNIENGIEDQTINTPTAI